jgi:hypothetical protein
MEIKDLNPDVLMLYRYFAYAAFMRRRFRDESDPEWFQMLMADKSGLVMFFLSPPGIYLMYSYAGIYLVIEGWRDLGLNDQKIDELLQSPFVDRLRRFRNATFHYQKDLVSWKHLDCFGTEEERTEVWLNQLYRELERFFAENTLPIPEALRAKIQEEDTHVGIVKAIKEFWSAWAERPRGQSTAATTGQDRTSS